MLILNTLSRKKEPRGQPFRKKKTLKSSLFLDAGIDFPGIYQHLYGPQRVGLPGETNLYEASKS